MAKYSLSEILPLTTAEKSRFRSKLVPNLGCLLWAACTQSRGYGQIKLRGTMFYTHRLAWALASATDPGSLMVCHHCDAPACCEPSHLFLGTHQDNMDDMIRKGRAGASGMPYGVNKKSGNRLRPFAARVELGCKRHNLGHYETMEEAGRVAMDFKIAYLAEAGLNYQEKK